MNIIIGIIIFCVSIFLVAWYLYEFGKRQKAKDDKLETEYLKLHAQIMYDIEHLNNTFARDTIKIELNMISLCEWKNKEMTQVAYTEYMRKFYAVNKDEFSPESIFGK